MLRTIAVTLSVSVLLSGCASTDLYPCVAVSSPNEILLNGSVQKKQVIEGTLSVARPDSRTLEEVESSSYGVLGGLSTLGPGGVAAGLVYINTVPVTPPPPSIGDKCPSSYEVANPISYLVAAEDGKQYSVLSAYPGFEINQCVKLFITPNSTGGYSGRIAGNGSCS